jgi:hypothetical protein
MANDTSTTPSLPAQGSGSITDLVTQLLGLNRNLSLLVQAYKGRITTGSFTFGAAATAVVPQPAVQSNSVISLTPLNASAATLVSGGHSPYISVKSPGVGFTVATADGGNAAGTELFSYSVTTPS